MRVLLVDDDPNLCRVLAYMLDYFDHEVVTAGDGPSALKALQKQPFDALVTDYRMPGMNGDQLARLAQEHDPDLAVVVMSGQPVPRGTAEPGWCWLEKPFPIQQLLDEIGRRPRRSGRYPKTTAAADGKALGKTGNER